MFFFLYSIDVLSSCVESFLGQGGQTTQCCGAPFIFSRVPEGLVCLVDSTVQLGWSGRTLISPATELPLFLQQDHRGIFPPAQH